MERVDGVRGSRRWSGTLVLVLMTMLAAAVGLVMTGSFGSMFGAAAVVALLVGSAVAFGVFDKQRDGTRGTLGLAPDGRTSALAEHVLGSLDGIEHRRVELGAPWPQLSVGPTGVVVVDVCGLEGPVSLDAGGIRRRDDQRSCTRCDAALEAGDAARHALAPTNMDVPVRTIAVVAAGTSVIVADDARTDVSLITVDELADVLARGPVLPMPVVDATFAVLSRTAMVPDLR
jgi:hypothetical protein